MKGTIRSEGPAHDGSDGGLQHPKWRTFCNSVLEVDPARSSRWVPRQSNNLIPVSVLRILSFLKQLNASTKHDYPVYTTKALPSD